MLFRSDRGGARGSTLWLSFVIYCQNLLVGGRVQRFSDYCYHNGTCLVIATKKRASSLKLGNCIKIEETSESLIVAARRQENENVVFFSPNKSNQLIDFLYRKKSTFFAFQVSIDQTHSCTPHHLKAAVEEAGDDYEFLLHYLTFDRKYYRFELDPVNPFQEIGRAHV